MLLGFTDLYHVFSSKESMYLDHLSMDFIIYFGIDNRKSLKTKVNMHFTGLKELYTFVVLSFSPVETGFKHFT